MWRWVGFIFVGLVTLTLLSCVTAARHPECRDRFDICSDTCGGQCSEGSGAGLPGNLSKAVPNMQDAGACTDCVEGCLAAQERCDERLDRGAGKDR